MSILDKIMAALDCPTKKLEVAEWGTTVYLKRWSLKDQLLAEQYMDDKDAFIEKIVAMSVLDETGKPVFTDTSLVVLRDKNYEVVAKVYQAVVDYNRIKPTVEEAEKK